MINESYICLQVDRYNKTLTFLPFSLSHSHLPAQPPSPSPPSQTKPQPTQNNLNFHFFLLDFTISTNGNIHFGKCHETWLTWWTKDMFYFNMTNASLRFNPPLWLCTQYIHLNQFLSLTSASCMLKWTSCKHQKELASQNYGKV